MQAPNPAQQKREENGNRDSLAEELKKSTGSDSKGREITFTIGENLYPIIEGIKTDLQRESLKAQPSRKLEIEKQIEALEQLLSEKKIEDVALKRLPEQSEQSSKTIEELKNQITLAEQELKKEIENQQGYATKALTGVAAITSIIGIYAAVIGTPIAGTIMAITGGTSIKQLFSYKEIPTETKETLKPEIDEIGECPQIPIEKPYNVALREIIVSLAKLPTNRGKKDSLQQCCNEQLTNIFIINEFLQNHHELLKMRLKLGKEIEELKTKTDQEKLHWIKNVAMNAVHKLCELGRGVPNLIVKIIPASAPVAKALEPVVETVVNEVEKTVDKKIDAAVASQ